MRFVLLIAQNGGTDFLIAMCATHYRVPPDARIFLHFDIAGRKMLNHTKAVFIYKMMTKTYLDAPTISGEVGKVRNIYRECEREFITFGHICVEKFASEWFCITRELTAIRA